MKHDWHLINFCGQVIFHCMEFRYSNIPLYGILVVVPFSSPLQSTEEAHQQGSKRAEEGLLNLNMLI